MELVNQLLTGEVFDTILSSHYLMNGANIATCTAYPCIKALKIVSSINSLVISDVVNGKLNTSNNFVSELLCHLSI